MTSFSRMSSPSLPVPTKVVSPRGSLSSSPSPSPVSSSTILTPSSPLSPPSYRLVYFDIPARGEAIRLAFIHAGIPFVDDRIPVSDNYKEFNARKAKGEFKAGSLPILFVNDRPCAQTSAILRYVGKLANLYPHDPQLALRVDEVIDIVEEIAPKLVNYAFSDSKERSAEKKADLVDKLLPKYLTIFETFLVESGSGFFVGNSFTIADLRLFGSLTVLQYCDFGHRLPELLSMYPKILQLYQAICSYPKFAEHFKKHKVGNHFQPPHHSHHK